MKQLTHLSAFSREREEDMNIFKVKQIKILTTEKEVNDYLYDGWVLFRVFSESLFLLVSFNI